VIRSGLVSTTTLYVVDAVLALVAVGLVVAVLHSNQKR